MPPNQHRNQDITVLIPAAGRVPEGLLALSNIGCTAMIPVAGRPVIYWTLTYLRSLGLTKFHIAVPERGLSVEDFVDCTVDKECRYQFVVPPAGPEGGLGQTVASLLDTVETASALVVLGDTYFQFADPTILNRNEPAVLTGPVEESYRWCIVEHSADGSVTRFRDKEIGLPAPLEALVGVYFFPDVAAARKAAAEGVIPNAERRRGVELVALLNALHRTTPIRAHPSGEWLDCGNPDRQAASHVTLLQKREFNELAIDRTLSTITKRSRLKRKFIDEINYLRLLPADLAVLFPRVIDYSVEWENPFVTMEFYGYATLADVYVYEAVDPGVWERVFRHLHAVITTAFMRYRQPIAEPMLVDMYLGKTTTRMKEMNGPETLGMLRDSDGPIRVNGKLVPSFRMIWPRVEQEVRALCTDTTGCVIHGDFCFSNVLYDLRSQIVKLVDPRGSFGSAGIMGDPRYDVAKLYHSVRGAYDFITNDLFHVAVSRAEDGVLEAVLDIRARPQHAQILARFEKVFFKSFDKRQITLLTALIFASIPALHYDRPARQIAMMIKSLELFGELFPL